MSWARWPPLSLPSPWYLRESVPETSEQRRGLELQFKLGFFEPRMTAFKDAGRDEVLGILFAGAGIVGTCPTTPTALSRFAFAAAVCIMANSVVG